MLNEREFLRLCERADGKRIDERIIHEVLGLRMIQHMDANEGAFFARELEAIKAQTFDILYPELRSRDFIPVDGSAGVGATQVTYQQFDRVGRAKIIGPNARDTPRVDVLGKEFPRPVRPWAAAYGWTIFEVQSAAFANRNLNARKASASRRAVEEGLDETAAIGAPDYGISEGFLNSTAVATQSVPNGAGGTPQWSTKTADEIIADVSAAVQRIVNISKGIHRPDTILLPDAQHALVGTKPRSTQSDTTVLEFILRSFPSITAIEPWYRLDGAGVGPSDRMVVYMRSADMLTQDITQEYTQLPTQEVGFEFVINSWAQTAGTAIYYPLSVDYSDDI